MKNSCLLILLCLSVFSAACGPAVRVASQVSERIHVNERTEYVPVMVKIDIPEVKLERVTRDTFSRLETKLAVSEACVHADGTLEHTLQDIPQTLEREAETKIVYKDSIVEKEVVVEKEVPVEKELTWWHRIRLDSFWILVGALLIAGRKTILKLFRI